MLVGPGGKEMPNNSWPAKIEKALESTERAHVDSKASIVGTLGTDTTQANIFIQNY